MPRLGPAERAAVGGAVLAAAKVVDTTLVRPSLARFEAVHQRYADAQRAVDAAEARVSSARTRFNDADREQASRIAALAGALTAEGQPRSNPFRGHGVPPPAAMQRLAVAAEAREIHRLVTAVRRVHPTATLVLERAEAADTAAAAAEAAFAALTAAKIAARAERVARDVIGQQWDHALAALNHAARAAADDGAVHLHAALFRGIRRPAPRRPRSRDS